MHRSLTLAVAFIAALSGQPAFADSSADVRSAVETLYKAAREADVPALAKVIPQHGFTEFNTDSSELQTYDLEGFRHAFEIGVKIDFHVERLHVDVHGASAVATGYRVGSLSFPDGRKTESYNCETLVLIREGSRWLVQHVHLSQCARPTKG